MLKKLNKCDFYILLWMLYSFQGVLYPRGTINILLQLIMLILAGIETLKVLSSRGKPTTIKSTFYLLIMYCVYGILFIISDKHLVYHRGDIVNNYVYLQYALNSILPIFLFYYYSQRRLLNEKRIIVYTFFFLTINIFLFYNYKYSLLEEIVGDEITNNIAYNFVSMIPLVLFFHKKPIVQYILLIVCFTFVLLGMKRGAILIGGGLILLFLFHNLKHGSFKKRFLVLILTSILVVIFFKLIFNMLQTSEYFVTRIEQTIEGNSSGRDSIYNGLWNIFINETNLFNMLFGYGANSTIGFIGNLAHQDWLETLINNGLFGLGILLFFFVTITKTTFKQRYRFYPYMYYSFLMSILLLFVKTLFTMSIHDIQIPQSLLLGYFMYWSTQPGEMLQDILK